MTAINQVVTERSANPTVTVESYSHSTIMNATEQISALKIRPRAKPGQIISGVDLSETERFSQVLNLLTELGYEPQLRYLELKSGLHVFAILKDEQHDPNVLIDDEYLMNEWETLSYKITPSTAVRMWRGYPKQTAM